MAPRHPHRIPAKKSAKKVKMELAAEAAATAPSSDDSEQDATVKMEAHDDLCHREIECAKGLNGEVSTYDGETGKYVQTITLVSDKPFSLVVKETEYGKDKGRNYIAITPEPTKEEQFSFLTLPPEIRNMIYSLILERPGLTIGIEGKWAGKLKTYWRNRKGRWIHASNAAVKYSNSLTRVNKQVHDETVAYLFGRHPFEFTDTTMLERFLQQIGPDRAQSLIHIKILRWYQVSQRRAFKLLKAATSLQEVELSCSYGSGGENTDIGTVAFRHAKLVVPVLQAMVDSGRDRDEALGVFKLVYGLRGFCVVHGSYLYDGKGDLDCKGKKKAYVKLNEELYKDMAKLLDEAERKKEKVVVKVDTKSRAGRKRKAVDYAEESDDDDEYTD